MILYPNCKINLGLYVTSKRPDGYHNLETIFYPVFGLHDVLEIEKADELSFIQEGITVDCNPEDNLIMKVVRLFQNKYHIGNVSIHFTKNIPFGAGLGGGSSDAAHTAIALNQIFDLNLDKETLKKEVRQLGADCPFFIENTPCYATGIGDELTPININFDNYKLVLVKPNINVSTKIAYSGIHPQETDVNLLRLDGINLNKDIIRNISNQFELTVFQAFQELSTIKSKLYELGADYAAMSGSGSTIFGLFSNTIALENYAKSGANANLRLLYEDASVMVFLDDSFGKA